MYPVVSITFLEIDQEFLKSLFKGSQRGYYTMHDAVRKSLKRKQQCSPSPIVKYIRKMYEPILFTFQQA